MGTEIWLDPTQEESDSSIGTLVISCMPALASVTNVWQTGQMEATNVLSVSLCHFNTFNERLKGSTSAWRPARIDVTIYMLLLPRHYLTRLPKPSSILAQGQASICRC